MATAPGSEPLAKHPRASAPGDAMPAGPCDSQDPLPRIPDDTPPDARPSSSMSSSRKADRNDDPGPGTATSTPAAADAPGAQEAAVEGDPARGASAHDTSGMNPPVAKTTASRG